MKTKQTGPRPLRKIEQEVMAEGREWTRQRLQQRLQEEANYHVRITCDTPIANRDEWG